MEFRDVTLKRRSVYMLKPVSPLSDEALVARLKETLAEAPSAFNGQAPRLVICLGDAHKKVWEIAKAELKKVVPPKAFTRTEAKLTMFGAAYGTLLLYTDKPTTEKLKADYPLYAKAEDEWADHNIGIMILSLWDTLVDLGLSANLQHYNPLIDGALAKEFQVPETWQLKGQIVFGTQGFPPDSKTHLPIDERVWLKK
jgi:uncharacterized protein